MSRVRALVGRHWLSSASRNLEPAAGDVFSPVPSHGSVMLALALRLGVDRSWLTRSGESIAGVVRSEPTNKPASAVRCFVEWRAIRNIALSHHSASLSPDASHEVFAPSARANRDALSEGAAHRTIPLRRYSPRRDPLSPRTFVTMTSICDLVLRPVEVGASPLRFYALRM
jgi:hypothetical protein